MQMTEIAGIALSMSVSPVAVDCHHCGSCGGNALVNCQPCVLLEGDRLDFPHPLVFCVRQLYRSVFSQACLFVIPVNDSTATRL